MPIARSYRLAGSALFALAVASAAWWLPQRDAVASPEVVVYKSATCGCCTAWIDHLRENGFAVVAHNVDDLPAIKRRHGVGNDLASCHTATVDGYVVEGHVPADDIKRLLAERPDVDGLAVPGMPSGSPGMEQGGYRQPYAVVSFGDRGTEVYSQH